MKIGVLSTVFHYSFRYLKFKLLLILMIFLSKRIYFELSLGVSVSKFADGFVVFHIKKLLNAKDKTPDSYPKVGRKLVE